MLRTVLAMIILTGGGIVLARGLRAWATREERAIWLPTVLQGVCWGIAGGAHGLGSQVWFALGAVGVMVSFVMQWRMRADA